MTNPVLLYDSDNPAAIPDGVYAAGYDDGYAAVAWTAAQWARFPGARHINVFPGTDTGDSFDCEAGDITPAQIAGCVTKAHARGIAVPWVYCNRANGPAVEFNLTKAGIALDAVALWIATLDGTQVVTHWGDGTAVRYPVAAVQYANAAMNPAHYDLSVVNSQFSAGGGALAGGFGTMDDQAILDQFNAVSVKQSAIGSALQAQGNLIIGLIRGLPAQSGTFPDLTAELDALTAANKKLDALEAELHTP